MQRARLLMLISGILAAGFGSALLLFSERFEGLVLLAVAILALGLILVVLWALWPFRRPTGDPFENLVPLLVSAIPQAVASLKPTKPICIVRIYFYDTHAPQTYLSLRTVSAECRDQVLAAKGRDAPFYIWSSGEECGDGHIDLPPNTRWSKSDRQIARLFKQVYALLCEDEDEHMIPLRQMLRQVGQTLNGTDWNKFCPVTDDFVVVPADGSMYFGGEDYEDLVESVPADRVALLRARRVLGPGETWEQLP